MAVSVRSSPSHRANDSPAAPSDLFVEAVLCKQFDMLKQELSVLFARQTEVLLECQPDFASFEPSMGAAPPSFASMTRREDLQHKTLHKVKVHARKVGIEDYLIASADEADDPKEVLINEIMQAEQREFREKTIDPEQRRHELKTKSLSKVKAQARKLGVEDNVVESADENDDPKEFVINQIIQRETTTRKKGGAGGGGGGRQRRMPSRKELDDMFHIKKDLSQLRVSGNHSEAVPRPPDMPMLQANAKPLPPVSTPGRLMLDAEHYDAEPERTVVSAESDADDEAHAPRKPKSGSASQMMKDAASRRAHAVSVASEAPPVEKNQSKEPPPQSAAPRVRRSVVDADKASAKDDDKKPVVATSNLNIAAKLASDGDLEEEQYNVANFYFEEGRAQAIARSDNFNNATLAVIAVNAVYMGVEMDNNTAATLLDSPLPYVVGENLFCVYFTFEFVVRFLAFEAKRNCLKDNWFKFDSVLCIMMILETWVMTLALVVFGFEGGSLPTGPFRLLRLMRLARMGRMMRALPELVTMMKGMLVATRAVASSLLLLMLMTYIFAVIMFLGLGEDPEAENEFGTIGLCMWTLMFDGIFMDNIGELLRTLLDRGLWYMVCSFMVFVLLAQMTVMNMLIGVLCEVVSAVAQAEKDELAIRTLKETVLQLLLDLDADGSGMIEVDELDAVLADRNAIAILEGLNVNIEYLVNWMSMYYDSTPSLSIRFVMNTILVARGDRVPTMEDLVNANKFSKWSTTKLLREELSSLKEDLGTPVKGKLVN